MESINITPPRHSFKRANQSAWAFLYFHCCVTSICVCMCVRRGRFAHDGSTEVTSCCLIYSCLSLEKGWSWPFSTSHDACEATHWAAWLPCRRRQWRAVGFVFVNTLTLNVCSLNFDSPTPALKCWCVLSALTNSSVSSLLNEAAHNSTLQRDKCSKRQSARQWGWDGDRGTLRPPHLMTCKVYHVEQRHGHLTRGFIVTASKSLESTIGNQ